MQVTTRSESWPSRGGLWLLLALPVLLYLLLPTRNFYWDGVAFAINIEKRLGEASLLHPSHLMYALAGEWLYELAERLGIHTRALFLLQGVNSVLAGLCVLLFYHSLRLGKAPAALAIPLALVFGFSSTWWKFATDADAYTPSIFFLLCAYVMIERGSSPFLAGLAQAGALLLHELAILFVPVALMLLLRRRRSAIAFLATALIPTAAAYVVAYHAVAKTIATNGFISWVTSHAPDSGFHFNPLSDAGFSIRGTLRLFFGGKMTDFARNGLSGTILMALLIALPLLLASLWRLRGVLREGSGSPLPPHLIVWAGVYLAFLFFWMPQNTFYRLFYLPALIAIGAARLPNMPQVRVSAWLFVVVLFGWNFCFEVYPQSRSAFNAPLHFALAQKNTWPRGTPIVFSVFHPDLWTISYFNQQAAWISIASPDVGELESILNYARSQNTPMWVEAAAYNMIAANPAGQRWLAVHERKNELLEAKDEKHDFRFYCLR